MTAAGGLDGFRCRACGATTDPPGLSGCPACGGDLEATYDREDVEVPAARERPGLWLLPGLVAVDREAAPTLGEGGTPLVSCPDFAAELGVGEFLLKGEGSNPTGAGTDRGACLAVGAAAAAGVETVALASTGDGGESVAAYAARAGLDARVYVPARAGFGRKAMVNVHGADMTVVGGRYPDAVAAAGDALAEHSDWVDLGPATPYRREGWKTVAHEVAATRDWTVPDAVVVPVGHGTALAGLHRGFQELEAVGATGAVPRLYAVQPEGCAPIVRAVESGVAEIDAWTDPDTICGGLEVPEPVDGAAAATAVVETGGDAVAVSDDDALETAVRLASRAGHPAGLAGGAAAAGAWALGEWGAFGSEESVVVLDPVSGGKDADVLRSHLMGQGI